MPNVTDELANWVIRINKICVEKDAEIVRLKNENADMRLEIEGLKHDIERHVAALANYEEYLQKLEPK